MNLEVRPMTAEDVSAMGAWLAQADAHAWSEQALFDSLQTGHRCWVGLNDGQLVGAVVFQCVMDEAELLYVVVRSECQGRGLGQAMLTDAMDKLHRCGVQQFFLEVRLSNLAAQKLYQKQGFVPAGRRKAYYPSAEGEREDALLMSRQLIGGEAGAIC